MKTNKASTNKIKDAREYPEELTLDESEKYIWLYSGDDEAKAYRTSKKLHGQVYTQLNVENKDGRTYLRGHHFVNRTGWYICVGLRHGREQTNNLTT